MCSFTLSNILNNQRKRDDLFKAEHVGSLQDRLGFVKARAEVVEDRLDLVKTRAEVVEARLCLVKTRAEGIEARLNIV